MQSILEQSPVIPVLSVQVVEDAFQLAELFIARGIHCLEITLRTSNALNIINALAEEYSQLCVGAGTVTSVNSFEKVLGSKAQFAVSPGFSTAIASMAKVYSLPYLPGVSTVSEMMQASGASFGCLKFFPAELSGGTSMLKTIHTVLPKLCFCPTGGINKENYTSYLELDNVLSVGMSALAPSELIREKNWPAIGQNIDDILGL